MAATNHHLGYATCKAKNHGLSIDTHFQTGAVTVSFDILPIKAANMLVMHSSDQITCQLPYIQD